MAESNILTTLRRKQAEIEKHIKDSEKRLAQARHDLAHVNATIRLFEVGDQALQFPAYVRLSTVFKRGELMRLCQEALQAAPEGTATTRELAVWIIAHKGWDTGDKALAVSVVHSVVTTLSERKRRKGTVELLGKRGGVNLWRLPEGR
jgi:hypothetical protein